MIYNIKKIYKKKFVLKIILLISFNLAFSMNCASASKKMDSSQELISDTGELTRVEMEETAQKFATAIHNYFMDHPNKNGIVVALLPTKNDTSENLPTEVFDNTLVSNLMKKGIFTVKRENRSEAMKEIEFSMSGLTENSLSAGNMKVPNYFIKTRIDESIFYNKGKKIVEQVVTTELTDVETQLLIWSEKESYRKSVKSRESVSW